MEEVFPPYDVFINHRGPDVKKTLASLIYYALTKHGLKVFLDKDELQVGDSLTPAIKSAISSASVQIAIFSETYAESSWCLDELVWMFDSHSSKIIPIFCDIQPSDLRYVDKGAYAGAFQDHIQKGRVTEETVDRWKTILKKVSDISGVVFNTKEDDYGQRLKEIDEIVLKVLRQEELDVCKHPVGLHQAAENFRKEVLNPSEFRGIKVVGIVGLGGSGKSTLVTHLYNSKCSQFQRCCFLSDVNKYDLHTLQQTLLRNLLRDQNLRIEDTRRGRTLLRDRLRGLTRVLIVFDDIDNREQIDNLLFVKDVLGSDSLILVTSRDQSLLVSSEIEIYNIKLLNAKHARELFCCHAFRAPKPLPGLENVVEELVKVCSGFPLALKVLAGQLHNERDPGKWKRYLESLRTQLPNDVLKQIVMNSYESLELREKEAFLDVAHFFMGEDTDLVERVLDGLSDNGFQCLKTLRHKCLVEFESANIIRGRVIRGESVDCRRAKGSFKIRMHDLVRDSARQMGRDQLPLRLCCSDDEMIWQRLKATFQDFGSQGSVQKYDVRGMRKDKEHNLPAFLQNQDIGGLKLLSVQNSTILQKFKSVSGDLTWFRWRQSDDTLNLSALLRSSLSNLLLRSLRVLEVHGVSPQDFLTFVDDREPPSQLRELEVTCPEDFGSGSTAGPSTSSGSSAGPSTSVSAKNLGQWFQRWLAKLNFKNLYKIVLRYIQGLNRLPIKFEEVRNLKHVDLSGCSDLEVLPDSFTEELLQLQYLALRDCRKLVLQDLGKISTLEYLDFQGCSMLQEMPKGTLVQKSLRYLNVVHTKLRKLPQQLEQLESLEELHIGSSELTEIPSSLCNLSNLTDLTLLGCTNLPFIDNSIEKLKLLKSFRVYDCGVRALPERIAWMKMKILDVQRCPLDSEKLLTGVDSGNMPLDSSQAQGSIDQCADPDSSSCLTDVIIKDSYILEINIPLAERLLPQLETVDLSNNRSLTQIGMLPGSLISLKLINCSKLEALTCLSNLARLKDLDISGCDELKTLNVKGLSSIEVIKANACGMLWRIENLKLLEKLSYFQISVNFFLNSCKQRQGFLPYLGRLTVLKELERCTQASLEIKRSHFTDVKLEGSILLYLITEQKRDQKCEIEVAFRDNTYTSGSPAWTYLFSNYLAHILMWRTDSEVFNDFKLSNDEAILFDIKIKSLNSTPRAQLLTGWMLEGKIWSETKSFLDSAISFGCPV